MINLTSLRVSAILNTSSGSCDAVCGSKMVGILRDGGITATAVELVEGKQVEGTLERLLKDKTEVLIVLGGDGTIRTAAEKCAQSQCKLIPLPGGTMNMLPRALYGEGSWDEVLRRILSGPALREVGGGEVGDHRFFCAGIFGSPALWADAREAIRKSRWLDVIDRAIRAYRRTFSHKISYRFDGGSAGATVALSTICPLISKAVASNAPAFEVAILDPSDVGEAASLAWSAVFSDWRDDDNATSIRADKVELTAGGDIPAILDGEKVMLPRTVEIRYRVNCFTAIVPE